MDSISTSSTSSTSSASTSFSTLKGSFTQAPQSPPPDHDHTHDDDDDRTHLRQHFMRAITALPIPSTHLPPTPASTPVKGTKRTPTEDFDVDSPSVKRIKRRSFGGGEVETPNFQRARRTYTEASDSDSASPSPKRTRRASNDDLAYKPSHSKRSRRSSAQELQPTTPSRRPVFRRPVTPPRFSIAYKPPPPVFEPSASPSPPTSPLLLRPTPNKRSFSQPHQHEPNLQHAPPVRIPQQRQHHPTRTSPVTPLAQKSRKSLHITPPISPQEWTRVAESVLRQVDWEEVARDVAGNRGGGVYKKGVRRLFEGKVGDELQGGAQ